MSRSLIFSGILFCLICFLNNCKTTDTRSIKNEDTGIQKNTEPGYSTLFIDAVISCDSITHRCNAEIIKTILSPIKLKKNQSPDGEIHPNSLSCTFLDAHYNVIRTIVIDNPLYQSLEYLDENKEYKRIQDIKNRQLLIFG